MFIKLLFNYHSSQFSLFYGHLFHQIILPGWLLHCGFPWIFSSTWRVHSRATIHLSQLCKSSKRILIVYCVLCYSKTRFQYFFDSFEEVLISDKHYLTRRRFALLFSLIMYFQNNRRTTLLKPFWFLLHFRGLSYTGFHVLHEFGLCPSVRSVSTFLNYRSELDLHSPFQNVRWMDNLRHQLKVWFLLMLELIGQLFVLFRINLSPLTVGFCGRFPFEAPNCPFFRNWP